MQKHTIFTAVLLGVIFSLCLSAPIASLSWLHSNPTLAEAEQGVAETMNLTAVESDQVREMMAVGAVIDFIFTLVRFICPAAVVGAIVGLVGGLLWYRSRYATGP